MEHRERQQVMHWFTREWHDGDLSDAAVDSAIEDYATHLADLTPRLSADVRPLAGLYLHDGQVQEWTSDEIDVAADSSYEHRFYVWPGHEFGVRFGSVRVQLTPASGDARR